MDDDHNKFLRDNVFKVNYGGVPPTINQNNVGNNNLYNNQNNQYAKGEINEMSFNWVQILFASMSIIMIIIIIGLFITYK
jgi:hypothetical protein